MKSTLNIIIYWICNVIIGVLIFACCAIAFVPVIMVMFLWNLLSKVENKFINKEQSDEDFF